MNQLRKFSDSSLNIKEGRTMVRFAPEYVKLVGEKGEFLELTDSRGAFLFLQFQLVESGKVTPNYNVAKRSCNYDPDDNSPLAIEARKQFSNLVKIHYDYKFEGDCFFLKLFDESIRKMSSKYQYMDLEKILYDLMSKKEFPVYFYYYKTEKRNYLQVAWSKEEYFERTGKVKKAEKAEEAVEEEALPLDI